MPPTFRFLTDDNLVLDSWPVFSPDGNTVLFQRQDVVDGPATLYSVPACGGHARCFFQAKNPQTGACFNAQHPDWSTVRSVFQIAFDDSGTIWLLDACTKTVQPLLYAEIGTSTYEWAHPAWFASGLYLLATDESVAKNFKKS